VAVHWPDSRDSYDLELLDPQGTKVASASGSGHWSVELFAPSPKPGAWTMRVIPADVTASSFHARAKLEPKPPLKPSPPKVLRPNLQANPPWDLSFVAPAAPFTGLPGDVVGFHPLSCTVDETAQHRTTRCLRFSVGPMNNGAGPYEARFDVASARPNSQGHLEGAVIQRLYRTDGSYVDRPAGKFVFHEAHAHFHVQDMLAYRLYSVVDARKGTLAAAGDGRKASFCTLDLMINDFGNFKSEPARYGDDTVCFKPPDPNTTLVMGITPGWSDVYTWDLPDQFVDFGNGGEGLYVVRTYVDGPNTILEESESDNVGYAYIRVTGDNVRLLERGIGQSPWDRKKVVLPLHP
jgi:hypothetical protein